MRQPDGEEFYCVKHPEIPDILDEAKEITSKDRQNDYGPPERNLENIADLWSSYLKSRDLSKGCLLPEDVALMMDLLKTARCVNNLNQEVPLSRDNLVDKAGYTRVAHIVNEERHRKPNPLAYSECTIAIPVPYDFETKLNWEDYD